MKDAVLRVSEIYRSIQGESTHAGRPCTFVRLAGCHLRCRYCDTPYALDMASGEPWGLGRILNRVQELGVRLVELTGGEPLLQKNASVLAGLLLRSGYEVLVETSGASDIGVLPAGAMRIMDIKGPRSGEQNRFLAANLEKLNSRDEVKFVLHDRGEYEWARDMVTSHRLWETCTVLFSPVFPNYEPVGLHGSALSQGLEPRLLAGWILEDGLPVRFQLQLHKLVWAPDARGV